MHDPPPTMSQKTPEQDFFQAFPPGSPPHDEDAPAGGDVPPDLSVSRVQQSTIPILLVFRAYTSLAPKLWFFPFFPFFLANPLVTPSSIRLPFRISHVAITAARNSDSLPLLDPTGGVSSSFGNGMIPLFFVLP